VAVTIKDIARELNISVSTVSYALNGGPRSVPEEVKARVLKTAQALGYRPNRVARSMVTGRSYTLGIVLPDRGLDVLLSPYLRVAMNAIVNEAGRLHHDILLYTRHAKTDAEQMMSTILDGRVDGVLFVAPHSTHATLEQAATLHMPCVAISGAQVDKVISFSSCNKSGVNSAMQHLYDLGHHRIAHIAGQLDMLDAIERMTAYQEFLYEKRIPYRDEYVQKGSFYIAGGCRAAHQLLALKDRPTAIFCANDEMGIGAIQACQESGLRVPEDMSVVGFDDAGGYVSPALTTVRQPVHQLCTAAVDALVNLIEGRPAPTQTEFETELIVRASTRGPKEDIP
jgi:LacI family transcriptional regulator